MRKCGQARFKTGYLCLVLVIPFVRSGMAEVYGQHTGVVVNRTPNGGKESSMSGDCLTWSSPAGSLWTTTSQRPRRPSAFTAEYCVRLFKSVQVSLPSTTSTRPRPSIMTFSPPGDDSPRRRLPSTATDDLSLLVCKADIPPSRCSICCLEPAPPFCMGIHLQVMSKRGRPHVCKDNIHPFRCNQCRLRLRVEINGRCGNPVSRTRGGARIWRRVEGAS